MRILLLTVSLLLFTGCGGGKRELEGEITFNGEPLKEGSILFVKTGPDISRDGGAIKDGKFKVPLANGTYDIQVSSVKVVGKEWTVNMGEKVEVEKREEILPERFNTKTELKYEVKSSTKKIELNLQGKK